MQVVLMFSPSGTARASQLTTWPSRDGLMGKDYHSKKLKKVNGPNYEVCVCVSLIHFN